MLRRTFRCNTLYQKVSWQDVPCLSSQKGRICVLAATCKLACVTCRFGTIHPLVKCGGTLPPRLQEFADFVRDGSGTTHPKGTNIIGRLQLKGCVVNLHSDLGSRGYWVNVVVRCATDGSGGTVDYVLDSDPTTVSESTGPGPACT